MRRYPPSLSLLLGALTLCSYGYSVTEDFVTNKKELRERYQRLYSLPVVQISAERRTFDQGTLIKYRGLNILSLRGDNFEMAFQHGRLLRQEIATGTVIDSAKMVDRAIDVTYGHRPAFAALAKRYIDKHHATGLLRNAVKIYPELSRQALERLFALSEAAGVELNTALDAAVNPSVMMMLANGAAVNGETVRLAPSPACTSFAAWDNYTPDGEMIIGRNTDYPLTGAYEKNATIMYFHPTQGQKYMAIITAGVHTSAVTGLNESGLYMVTHSLPSTATGQKGVPAIMWMNDVLERAKTIDEAIKILTSRQAEVGWTYVLASAKEKRVVSVEVDNGGFGLRESRGGKHVQTNHYLSAELKNRTLFFNESSRQETLSRFDRADLLLEESKGMLNERSAQRILADHTDTYSGKNNGFPNNIGGATTSTSLVYKPAAKKLWVALGSAPTSDNMFAQLPTPQDFDANTFPSGFSGELPANDFRLQFPNRFTALQKVIEAKQIFEYQNDAATALRLLREARALAPEVAHYSLMEGMLLIRTRQYAQAESALLASLEGTMSAHGYVLAHYFLGRLYGDAQASKKAKLHLQRVLADLPEKGSLYTAAETALRKVTNWGGYRLDSFEVIPQFQFGDSQTY